MAAEGCSRLGLYGRGTFRRDQEVAKKNADFQRREAEKELANVEARADQRLALRRDWLDREMDRVEHALDGDENKLKQQTEDLVAEADRVKEMAAAGVSEFQCLTLETTSRKEERTDQRDSALNGVRQMRADVAETLDATERRLDRESKAARDAITHSEVEVQDVLNETRYQRANFITQARADFMRAEQRSVALADQQRASGDGAVLHAETARHHAAMLVDVSRGKAEATKAEAERFVKLNQEKSRAQVLDLDKFSGEVNLLAERALAQRMAESHGKLEQAKDYCADIRRVMKQETDLYKERMHTASMDATGRAKELDDTMRSMEVERLDQFADARRNIIESIQYFQKRREACDEEIHTIEQRVREVQRETTNSADELLQRWLSSSRLAEETVRRTERSGLEALQAMQEQIKRDLKQCEEEFRDVQARGTGAVKEFHRQTFAICDGTTPNVEAARREDEAAAHAALCEHQRIRNEPERIQAAADTATAACMAQADEEIEKLEQEARQLIEECKRNTRAAHEEEQMCVLETHASWTRFRTACYQLRLGNLHGLAHSAATGAFDAQIMQMPQVEGGDVTWS